MKNIIGPIAENVLDDIHSKLLDFPMLFRDKVNEECAWSTPTFYRKRKDPAAISNAEREKIVGILDEVFQNLREYFDKYRKRER
jgi:hypothetical protein